jgi:hypothetical protein
MEMNEIRPFLSKAMGIIGKLTVEAAPPDEEMYDF